MGFLLIGISTVFGYEFSPVFTNVGVSVSLFHSCFKSEFEEKRTEICSLCHLETGSLQLAA